MPRGMIRGAPGCTVGPASMTFDKARVSLRASRSNALEPILAREDRFQVLANVSPIGIFEADATGCCTFMNPVWEAVCQQPADKALGFGWLDIVHPDDRSALAQPPVPDASSSTPIEQHFRIVRPSGEVRSLRIRLGSV